MGLRFDPIGGGAFKEALKQIIEAESHPLKQLEARKGREEARYKLFQDFKGRFQGLEKVLNEFTNFKKFRELKVDLGNGEEMASVTVDKERAQPGSYEIEVGELAARTSAISNGFTEADKPVLGIGFVVVKLPDGDSYELFVDESKSSLYGVADLINAQKEAPVRAAVVRDASTPDNPWKLILSGKEQGMENDLLIPDFYFLDGERDFYFIDDKEAQNALLTVDGFEIEANSNQIRDFMPGVNLNLRAAKPGVPFTLTITEDTAKISGKVKSLVEEFNKVLGFINDQNKIDESSDTRTTFGGDTGLQGIEYKLRNLLHESFPVGDPDDPNFRVFNLSEIGIEFDKVGTLQFKEDKFKSALEGNFTAVAEALCNIEYGFASQMREVTASYTRVGEGLLAVRERGIKTRIKSIDDQIETKQRQIERKQQALTEQFARLQGSLGNLQRQQQYLQATMPTGGGGNLVQQLLGG